MIEQGAAVPLEVRVRWEIWESFVAMLRVYANAASIDRGEFTVTALHAAACVTHEDNVLRLSFDPLNGEATWRFSEEGLRRQGSFRILESGALSFDGQEKQLDEAAIDWIEALACVEGSAGEARSVPIRTNAGAPSSRS